MLCQHTDIHVGIAEAGLASGSHQRLICALGFWLIQTSIRSSLNGQGRDVDRLGRKGE